MLTELQTRRLEETRAINQSISAQLEAATAASAASAAASHAGPNGLIGLRDRVAAVAKELDDASKTAAEETAKAAGEVSKSVQELDGKVSSDLKAAGESAEQRVKELDEKLSAQAQTATEETEKKLTEARSAEVGNQIYCIQRFKFLLGFRMVW